MDDSEYADILGRSTLPQRHVPKSSLPFAIKTAFALGLFLALYVVATYAWDALLRWRELNYKMSVRRKHGIPDSDRRPFNVAHAAVTVARQDREREAANRRFEQNLRDQRAEQNIRQRPAQQSQIGFIRQNHSISSRFPGSFSNAAESSRPTSLVSTSYPSHSAQPNRVTFADDYTTPNPVAEATGPSRRPKKGISILKTSSKRALDDDEEVDQSKKSRVDGEEFIDGDEDAEWQKNRASHGPNRVSKRQLIDGDSEDFIASKRTKDNRTQGPLDDSTLSDDDMEVDDEMAPVSVRGQKRHRTENGSPVGSVDDAEQPEEVDGQSRRRKRRNKRRSDVGVTSRGQKRDRDAEQSSSEENEAPKLSRKKRGKKSQVASQEEPDDEKASDISMDDASPRGRKVGETWESNGVEYKLGPDGVRLRKCLMRKDQPKFNMPKDSLHPDRDGRIVVHIESWLTETEYQEAKAKGLFNHQDEGKVPETPPPVVKEKPSPVKPSGKHLLWDATGPSYLTSAKNPFDGSPRAVRKFIPDAHLAAMTSPHRIASALLTDSTNGSLRQYQQYTKWEKQDLEAKAMMKVRQAKNNREKEKEEKEKAASASLIPSISLTKPAEDNLFKKPDAQPPPFGADMFKKPAPAASPLGAGGDFFKSTPAPSALGQDSSKKPSLADAPPLGAVANVAPSSGAASGPSPSLFPAFSPAPAAAPIQAPAQPQQAPASTFAFNSGQNANNMFAQKAAEKPSLSSAGFPSNFNPTPPAVQPTQPAAAAKPMSAFTSAPAGNLFGPPKPNPAPNPASVSSFQFPPSNSASGPSLLGRIRYPDGSRGSQSQSICPCCSSTGFWLSPSSCFYSAKCHSTSQIQLWGFSRRCSKCDTFILERRFNAKSACIESSTGCSGSKPVLF
ncbi:hypothetical protein C8J56DRAFT_563733 [Mycena floridula]|nr:hypothetical protein C8J56DRAFT_563733 [Mycena floridula]